MNFRYLFPLVILVFPGSISYILPRSPANFRQAEIITLSYNLTGLDIVPDVSDTIADPKKSNKENSVQDFSTDMVIQVGAFRQEVNANGLKDRLSAVLDKPVIIIHEDGFFKVRIIRFASLFEIEKIIPTLNLLGYRNFWVFIPKKKPNALSQIVVKPDTSIREAKNNNISLPRDNIKRDSTFNPDENKVKDQSQIVVPPDSTSGEVDGKSVVEGATITLQVAIFYKRSEAVQAQRRIINKLNLRAEVIQEWNYYRVIIAGFHSKEETFKYYPELTKLGYPSSYMIENYNSK
jgi:hypothetical protein